MKPGERHPCPCQCGCTCSAAGALCAMCSDGIHASAAELKDRLLARAREWSRIVADLTPDSSSGISARALQLARDRFGEP